MARCISIYTSFLNKSRKRRVQHEPAPQSEKHPQSVWLKEGVFATLLHFTNLCIDLAGLDGGFRTLIDVNAKFVKGRRTADKTVLGKKQLKQNKIKPGYSWRRWVSFYFLCEITSFSKKSKYKEVDCLVFFYSILLIAIIDVGSFHTRKVSKWLL